MNENPLEPKANSDSADSLPDRNPVEPILTRRSFLGKIIALGALAHFSLFQQSMGADDGCRDVSPNNDNCDPDNQDPDACPTGTAIQDVCSNNDPDVCHSGFSTEDECPPNGGVAEGDVCRGGGSSVGGTEMDACKNNIGDECTPSGNFIGVGDDACDDQTSDICTYFNDDVCYTGSHGATGGDDVCEANWASDGCFDGTDEQDRCMPSQSSSLYSGAEDSCYGNGTDQCGDDPQDPDECASFSSGDLCPKTGDGNPDLCPAFPQQDTCDAYAKDPD